jgi:glutaredoxin
MGRITIFTSASCGHCRRAKATLESRGFEYSEVSLSAHPARREDMTALASRVTVPQIFLNETHFGGNDDLERRLREDPDGFDEEVRRALTMPDPKDARLRACAFGEGSDDDDDDDLSFLSPPRDARLGIYADAPSSLGETKSPPCDHFEATFFLRQALTARGAIRDVAVGKRVYARCFDGVAFRDATLATFFTSSASTKGAKKEDVRTIDAVASVDRICASLLAHGTVVRVALSSNEKEEEPFSENDDVFGERAVLFRLRFDTNPGCVSDARLAWPEDESFDSADPNATLKRCMRVLSRLETKHTTVAVNSTNAHEKEPRLNRASLANDQTFLRLVDRLSFLKKVRLETLREKRSDARLAAFLINAYNAAVRVSMTTVGVPRDALARATYFKRVGVRFADGFYSLDDIEHGLLRGNVESSRGFLHFGGTRRPIERGDPREAHVVRWDASSFSNKKHPTLRDPRVHFALNCGARSCPPVSFYEGETLDEALQTAAEGFCEDDANVDVVANTTTNKTTVRLSKLFSWYRGDFGASDAEMLERVADWCPRGSAKKKALLTSLTALANTVNDDARKKKKRRIEISYAPYDWSVDATADSPTYASANARESWGRFTGSFWESFWS